jgi:hypothetical protein
MKPFGSPAKNEPCSIETIFCRFRDGAHCFRPCDLWHRGNRLPCLVLVLLAVMFCLPPAFARASAASLLTTINNPTPAASDLFGTAVAAMGSDRVLVGAEGAAEAYLFNLNGALLTTFTKPDPAAGSFGAELVGVGDDRVLISAYNYSVGVSQVGRAYLFRTNGTLLTTFTNPAPVSAQAFGFSVAAVGTDRVLIGSASGGPFLFTTNGVLVTTFTKPGAGTFNNFGTSMAAVGNDRVLIGAQDDSTGASGAGTAYLFRTNGTLLTTFTNPAPVVDDNFGTSLAWLGNDRVVISAVDYGNVRHGGRAYIFGTNGTLITTITNPTPGYTLFGWSVAAVGSTRVLIGAYQDNAGANQAGAAYLFGTNGTLLTTITNPTPANQDWFAYGVAAMGTDRAIIGAVWDDTGAPDAGSTYVYALPYPLLSITRNASTVSISWVTEETGLTLQESGFLAASAAWSNATNSVSLNGPTNIVQQPIVGATNRFYRLHRQ